MTGGQTVEGATLSVAAILAESARRYPDHPALLAEGASISYRELWMQTRTIAGVLDELGVRPGTSVAMMFPNVPDFVRVYYAILALGAIVVPVHPLLRADEIRHVLDTSGAVLLVADASGASEARSAAEAVGCDLLVSGDATADSLDRRAATASPIETYRPMNPLAPATMLFTSGTSGKSKGALLSHFGIVEQTHVALIDAFDVQQSDVFGAVLPLSHVFGQSNVLNTSFRRGATVALLQRFSPVETLAELVSTGCTLFAGVPTMFIGLVEAARAGARVPGLRYVLSGGSSLPEAVIEEFTALFGCSIHEGYGLSETSPTVAVNHVREETAPGTVGTAMWGIDLRIVAPDDDQLTFLPHDEIGEVVVRGHGLFLGYQNDPEATADSYVDGWFRTGDLGRLDAAGRLTIVDRTKDLIIRGGYNVYPREIEEVLARMPGVRRVAVFGVPDDRLGQEVVAAVIAEPAVTAGDVVAYAQERIARHKYPRKAIVMEDFPLGPSGKILKRELSRRWAEQDSVAG